MTDGPGAARRLSLVAAFAILGVLPAARTAASTPAGLIATDRGHAYLTLNTNLRSASHVSAWAIDAYLRTHTPLPPLGHAFKAAEAKYNVNALYLLAHAMHETAFGTSFIAQRYRNLFGWQAYDRDPTAFAMRFRTFAASVDYVANQVSIQYLARTGKFYGGAPTLRGMHYYASDPHWGTAIVGIANGIYLPTLSGLGVKFQTPVAATLSTAQTGRVSVTSNGRLPDGLRAAYRFVPVAVVEAGAPTGTVPALNPPFRLASGSASEGTLKLKVMAPTRPGRYRLELELRDSDGTLLAERRVPAIPDATVRVFGSDAVSYSLAQTDSGLAVTVTNVGRREIPAVGAPLPSTTVAAVAPTILAAWLIDADGTPSLLGQVSPMHKIKPGARWTAAFHAPEPARLPAMLLVRLSVGGDPARLGGSPPGVYRLTLSDPPSAGDSSTVVAPNPLTGIPLIPGLPVIGPGGSAAPSAAEGPSTPTAPPVPTAPPASAGPGSPADPSTAAAQAPAGDPPQMGIADITPADAATRLLLDPKWKPTPVARPTTKPAQAPPLAPLRLGYLAVVNPKQAGTATLRITNVGTAAVPGPSTVPLPAPTASSAGLTGQTIGNAASTPGAVLSVTAVPAWGPSTSAVSFGVPLPAGIAPGRALDLTVVLPSITSGQSTYLVTARVIAADGRAASMTAFWMRSALPTLRASSRIRSATSAPAPQPATERASLGRPAHLDDLPIPVRGH